MLAASQRHHDDPSGHKHHHHHSSGGGSVGVGSGGLHGHHHGHHHHGGHHHGHHVGHHGLGGLGVGVGAGGVSMSCSPAPDSSQDGVHDLDDEKLDVVGTSDGRDGASPLHISDGKCVSVVPALFVYNPPGPRVSSAQSFFGGDFYCICFFILLLLLLLGSCFEW